MQSDKTTGFTKCFEQGVNNFNDGKFKTADQVQDAAKILKRWSCGNKWAYEIWYNTRTCIRRIKAAGRTLLGEKPKFSFKIYRHTYVRLQLILDQDRGRKEIF